VLATSPAMVTTAERRQTRRWRLAMSIGALLLALAAGATAMWFVWRT